MHVGTVLEDIEPTGIEPEEIVHELAQLEFIHHSSLDRCWMYSPILDDMIFHLSYSVRLIDKIFNINWMVRLVFSINIKILLTDVLQFDKFYTKESLVYLLVSVCLMQDSP